MFGLRVRKLQYAANLMQQRNLEEALQEIKRLENVEAWEDDEQLHCKLLKSHILTLMGTAETGLQLAEKVLQKSQELNNQLLVLDAIIAKARALLNLGRFTGMVPSEQLQAHLQMVEQGEHLLSTFILLQPPEYDERDAWLKRCKGILYRTRSELELSLQCLKESLRLFEKLNNNQLIVDSLWSICLTFEELGENVRALEFFKKKALLYKKIINKNGFALSCLLIGIFYYIIGDLDLSWEYCQKGLELFIELKFNREFSICLNYLGHVCLQKGELDQTLEYYQQSLDICEKHAYKDLTAHTLHYIGVAYTSKGEYGTAFDYNKRGLKIAQETTDLYITGWVLYSLVILAIETESVEIAGSYFRQLQEINEKTDFRQISQLYRVAKAKLLSTSTRLRDKVEAQELFQQVAEEDVTWPELTFTAMLNLGELLLFELKTTGDEKALDEVKSLTQKLVQVAQTHKSNPVLAETYLLQSKLALLELDPDKAQRLLTQAQLAADEKGLGKLSHIISLERDLLLEQLTNWEKIIEQKPSMSKIIELTQLEDLMERMIYKKLVRKDEEILAYARKARRLVEDWVKG